LLIYQSSHPKIISPFRGLFSHRPWKHKSSLARVF